MDKHILKESKTKRKNLDMARVDYKTAYNMVPQSWIIDCLKMYKIYDEGIKFIENTMKKWKVKMTARRKSLTEMKILGDFPGRGGINITTCNCDHAIQTLS